ncbi:A disintegrin and metalloproteinase with thrombospondin motifs adt-2-like isoform X1 [Linepithema humile]|uniref:A disintegrin and metalloproteinase with thrombospondin motifs adt-2-like isoform X1 n=2 Tax=Linepithema humile TaxID=83485 RepID=UPI00351F0CBD
MSFILQLVLIFLLNKTYAYSTQKIERILLPAWNPTSAEEISLTLKVFGTQIQLNMHRNDQIVSSLFKEWKYDAKKITGLSQLNAPDLCYYFHKDHISTAVINFCQEHGWEGFVFLKDEILEIRPLRHYFASSSSIYDLCVKEEINISFSKPYLIEKSLQLSADSNFRKFDHFKLKRRFVRDTLKKLTIKLAVFFDAAAYHTFMPFLDKDEEKLHMMILAYVNRIQAVFHHPSLGASIDISLVHLDIMRKQPSNLPVSDDDEKLLNSFCNYTITLNPKDNDPNHWDIGLYLTGMNIYKTKRGKVPYSTGGTSNINSACTMFPSCVVTEFGSAGALSSGFSSSLIAAHEIGHVLGMLDDEALKSCHKLDYIMSSIQLHFGQITWSKCSQNLARVLWYLKPCLRSRTINIKDAYDHSYYHDLPGREWNAKAQCEIYFRDKDANVVTLLDICKTLQCETPHKKGFYVTGPALEGTYCAPGMECSGGQCVPVIEPPYIFKYCKDDNWSEWKGDTCQSGCFEKSKGVKIKRRSCKHENLWTSNCGGPYYDVILCNDSMLCNESRMTISEYTAVKCNQFISIVKRTNSTKWIVELESGPGVQVLHNVAEPWKACSIHCRKKNSSIFFTPRYKMLGFNMDPYFPDGTWCHNEDGQDYYCRQHYCLPPSYS